MKYGYNFKILPLKSTTIGLFKDSDPVVRTKIAFSSGK